MSQQRAALSAHFSNKTSCRLHVTQPAKTSPSVLQTRDHVCFQGDLVLRLWGMLLASAFVPHFNLASSQSFASQVFIQTGCICLHLKVDPCKIARLKLMEMMIDTVEGSNLT